MHNVLLTIRRWQLRAIKVRSRACVQRERH